MMIVAMKAISSAYSTAVAPASPRWRRLSRYVEIRILIMVSTYLAGCQTFYQPSRIHSLCGLNCWRGAPVLPSNNLLNGVPVSLWRPCLCSRS